MSKMGQDFFDMQEDAVHLTKEAFLKKHGANNADLYDQIRELFQGPEQEYLTEG
jgi:hypothetical protein|tara:strand:- start:233 stop:394 length:162 start_codon:yes stop_codon:yes gene_type:complete